jgi:hypothetical protein
MTAMTALAASRTGPRQPAPLPARVPSLAFVEDLNWPVPGAPAQRKPARPPELRAPGPEGPWGDVPRTRQ